MKEPKWLLVIFVIVACILLVRLIGETCQPCNEFFNKMGGLQP